MTTDEVTWQRDALEPEPCGCGVEPLPIGGPEGGALVHGPRCPEGGRYGIT